MSTFNDQVLRSNGVALQLVNTTQMPQIQPLVWLLQWKQERLQVGCLETEEPVEVICRHTQSELIECLSYSSADFIYLEPQLDSSMLSFWINVCEQADKPVYLNFDDIEKIPRSLSMLKRIAQLINCIGASLLLLLFSPVFFLIALLIRSYSKTVLHREWRVGAQGKLFQLISFSTQAKSSQPDWAAVLQLFLASTKLYKLPQLINVLQGEMTWFGRPAWTLEELTKLDPQDLEQVGMTPGII